MYNIVATIGILNDDNTVDYIYVTEDGLPDYTSVLLISEYKTEDRVRDLIDNGSIEKVGIYNSLHLKNGEDTYKCVLEDYLDIDEDIDGMNEEYRYLYNDGIWECYDCYWEDTVESFKSENDEDALKCIAKDCSGKFDMYLYQKVLNRHNYKTIMEALGNRELNTYIDFEDYIDMKAWNIKRRNL